MRTNILKVFYNLKKHQDNDLKKIYKGSNRANIMGDALEYYVKDLFCDTLKENNIDIKDTKHSKFFSYIGNQNNPPDFIIKQGEAVEVKKIQNYGSAIALNSSYPKAKLYVNSPMITTACKKCESWKSKDVIYTIGVIKENKVKLLWFIYGDCYAADFDVYERVKKSITKGLREIRGVELSKTIELGRVNKVDPLGITYLRIRGMWAIENPINVFNYILKHNKENNFAAYAIIRTDKYNSLPKDDKAKIKSIISNNLSLENINIKNPNNPAQYLPAKMIRIVF